MACASRGLRREPPKPPAGVTYRYRISAGRSARPPTSCWTTSRPAATGTYLDKTFAWEQKYEYRITTLGEVQAEGRSAAAEGEDSPPVEIYTRDIYPPGQPAGLQAVFSSVGQKPFIDLTWAPNQESDLAGYNVYRWLKDEKPAKLNPQLVQTPSFRDDKVLHGKTYFYSVSAVDLRGNESPNPLPPARRCRRNEKRRSITLYSDGTTGNWWKRCSWARAGLYQGTALVVPT